MAAIMTRKKVINENGERCVDDFVGKGASGDKTGVCRSLVPSCTGGFVHAAEDLANDRVALEAPRPVHNGGRAVGSP